MTGVAVGSQRNEMQATTPKRCAVDVARSCPVGYPGGAESNVPSDPKALPTTNSQNHRFLPAFVPFEDGDDVERMHQQTNKRHSPPTSVDPAMPTHPPKPDVASRSSPVAPQKLWIGTAIFTGFCALAIPFWAKVLFQRIKSRIDRTILLLADIDERVAEIYLIDAHQSNAGYASIIFFGALPSLLPYLEMSVKDRARWFQRRQREWEKERQILRDIHEPNPWLGTVAD